MSVSKNDSGTPYVTTTPATSLDLTTFTVSAGSNLCLIAFLLTFTDTTTDLAVHWDSGGANQNMTNQTEFNASGYGHAAIFSLVAPTTGNLILNATWTGSSYGTLAAIAFAGVDQVTPIVTADTPTPNQSSGTTHSLAIPSSSDDATFGAIHLPISPSTTTQTEIWLETALGSAGSYALGGTTNTHTWAMTSGATDVMGVHIKASGGAPPSTDVWTSFSL